MSWPKFLVNSKKRHRQDSFKNSSLTTLDQKLVQNMSTRRLPSFAQLKYLGQFLSRGEKRIIQILTSISLVTFLVWAGWFMYSHISVLPKDGGEYSEGLIGQPKNINPLFASTNDVDADISSLIYSQLFRYDTNRNLVGDLVDSYTVSDDKKQYTLKLKPNIRWSDGEPLTANDVVYTLDLIKNPETNSPLISSFQGVEVEKTDELSIRLTLKEAFTPFLHSLAIGILPEHIWSAYDNPTSLKLAKQNLQPVGSGPWKFEKLIKKDDGSIQSYMLSRNDNYYGKKPYLKTVTFKFFDNYDSALEALHSQTILAISFVPHVEEEKVSASKKLITYPLTLPQYTALFFNLKKSPLSDKNTRTALAASLDKKTILQKSLLGEGVIIDSPFLPGQIGYLATSTKKTFTLEEANALLDKNFTKIQPEEYFKLRFDSVLKDYNARTAPSTGLAGSSSTPSRVSTSTSAQLEQQITDLIRKEMSPDQNFYRKDKKNNPLILTLTTIDTPEYERAATEITQQWKTLGITTTIQTLRKSEITRQILREHNYDILLYGEIVGADPDPFPFWHSSQMEYPGLNLSLFSDPTSDKLLQEARTTIDPAAREKAYQQFQTILNSEVPAVFLYTPSYNFIVNKQVRGIQASTLVSPVDRYNDLNNWYIKTRWRWK